MDLSPKSTVWDYLGYEDWDGLLGRIHHAHHTPVCERAGHEAKPA